MLNAHSKDVFKLLVTNEGQGESPGLEDFNKHPRFAGGRIFTPTCLGALVGL